tara:strand:- start:20197 stop:20664 length:468 start_codon:yes stop_codon:yes gene_type:complete
MLEVTVKQAPTVRYTQDNKTPIAEMDVLFEGLRADDSPGTIKAVGWGNMAQELQNRVQTNQKLIIEGRLRMNTIPRQDGTKEKRAELTISKIHFLEQTKNESNSQVDFSENNSNELPNSDKNISNLQSGEDIKKQEINNSWDSSPLIPETDEIPF